MRVAKVLINARLQGCIQFLHCAGTTSVHCAAHVLERTFQHLEARLSVNGFIESKAQMILLGCKPTASIRCDHKYQVTRHHKRVCIWICVHVMVVRPVCPCHPVQPKSDEAASAHNQPLMHSIAARVWNTNAKSREL